MSRGRQTVPSLPDRYEGRAPPFDGRMASIEGPVTLGVAREVLAFLLEALRAEHPRVVVFRDWWEHDGQAFDHALGDWSPLERAIGSDEALLQSRAPDFAVRIALYPPSREWLLRYEVDDERECSLDWSVTPGCAASGLVEALSERWPSLVRVVEARDYFRRSFGGQR